MRYISVLFAFVFVFAITSYALPNSSPRDFSTIYPRKNGNNTDTSPEKTLKKQCRKLRNLERITSIASNQTKIDELVAKGMITAADVTELKAKAANATTTLESLQSNTTLVAECNIVNAHRKDVDQCRMIQSLTRLTEIAGNQTALKKFAAKKGMNETRLQEKVTEAETKLKEMETNTTLKDFCAQTKLQQGDGRDGSVKAAESQSGAGTGAVQEAAKNSAATLQTMSYLLAPALMGFFVVFM